MIETNSSFEYSFFTILSDSIIDSSIFDSLSTDSVGLIFCFVLSNTIKHTKAKITSIKNVIILCRFLFSFFIILSYNNIIYYKLYLDKKKSPMDFLF